MATRTTSDHAQAVEFCLACWLSVALIGLAVAASFAYLSLDLTELFGAEARNYMWEFAVSFFPPDLSPAYLAKVARGTMETLAISAVGTLIAAVLGLVLALPAAGRYGLAARGASRLILNTLRSVPELVWGVLMVLAAGLGAFAGTLAIALHTAGVLGRLFAEALENCPPEPQLALVETGSPAAIAFLYGTFPTVFPQLVAYSLYRWEMNIRMAAILGFVGAGGLGGLLHLELSLFNQAQAATVILAMLVLVILVDTASTFLRRRFVRAAA